MSPMNATTKNTQQCLMKLKERLTGSRHPVGQIVGNEISIGHKALVEVEPRYPAERYLRIVELEYRPEVIFKKALVIALVALPFAIAELLRRWLFVTNLGHGVYHVLDVPSPFPPDDTVLHGSAAAVVLGVVTGGRAMS